MYLHPDVDWREFSLTNALQDTIVHTFPTALRRGDVVRIERPDLELVWAEVGLLDPDERREARTRVCLARRGTIQALITMDFWETDLEKFAPVWDEVLRSLRVGVAYGDPRRGDVMN